MVESEHIEFSLLEQLNLRSYFLDVNLELGRGGNAPKDSVEIGCAFKQAGAIVEHDHVNSIIEASRADLCALARPRLDDPGEVLFNTQSGPASPADEIRIVDWDGNSAAPGASGELLTRGPYTIRGYYNAPEHNARAFTPDGFYRAGDVVRIKPDGNSSVEGRVKDMINRGGEKISAEEVEDLILGHPAVQNVAVVAMPDKVMGEKVCAYVIPRPGGAPSLEALRQFMDRAGISKFKLPERLEVVERLPLTTVGKISKKDLREDIAAKFRAEGKIV